MIATSIGADLALMLLPISTAAAVATTIRVIKGREKAVSRRL